MEDERRRQCLWPNVRNPRLMAPAREQQERRQISRSPRRAVQQQQQQPRLRLQQQEQQRLEQQLQQQVLQLQQEQQRLEQQLQQQQERAEQQHKRAEKLWVRLAQKEALLDECLTMLRQVANYLAQQVPQEQRSRYRWAHPRLGGAAAGAGLWRGLVFPMEMRQPVAKPVAKP